MAIKKHLLAITAIFWLTSLFFIFPPVARADNSSGMCVCAVTEANTGSEMGGSYVIKKCLTDVNNNDDCQKQSNALTACYFFTDADCSANESFLSQSNEMMTVKTTVPCKSDSSSGCNPTKTPGGEGLCRGDNVCWMNDVAYNKWRASENPDQVAFSAVAEDLGIKKPLLEFHLPGLSFTEVKNTLDSEGYIHLPYIGELIAAVYKFGMVVGSIVAAVMIIVSGARVIVSAGGEGKVEGYKRIGEIVVGLVIMWGSYAILFNINPDLVNFKALKIEYIKPIAIEDEGNPDKTESKDVTFTGTGLDSSCNHLAAIPTYYSSQNNFGADNGYCLRWVKEAIAHACGGKVPSILRAGGAWDAAAAFAKAGLFHPCDLTGIKDGDIVFMTSIGGSNYIGLWNNFRVGDQKCTIADAASSPTKLENGKVTPYSPAVAAPSAGMPPVTHIGIYYKGNVYHLTKGIQRDGASSATALSNFHRNPHEKENWKDPKITFTGNFLKNGAEYIAGYATWPAETAPQ